MGTETLTVKVIEDREKSIKVECNGATVFLPRSQIERYTDKPDGKALITIPAWLYREKFE